MLELKIKSPRACTTPQSSLAISPRPSPFLHMMPVGKQSSVILGLAGPRFDASLGGAKTVTLSESVVC